MLINVPILFILAVYDDIITQGKWIKVGKLPIKDSLRVKPLKFIQDALDSNNYELYDPNTGEITKASKEKCVGLERAAVWKANHVEDRIKDHYIGKLNVWVEQLKIK